MSCLVSHVTASVLAGRSSAPARLCVTGKTTRALNALYRLLAVTDRPHELKHSMHTVFLSRIYLSIRQAVSCSHPHAV
jgi:hypothetical protein